MSVPSPIVQYNLSDATMKGLLPSGYTPLAYIYTDGTHVIDTGYQPTASTRLQFKASDMYSMYIGARLDSFDSTGANMYSFYAPAVNQFRLDWLGWTDTAPFSNSYEVFAYEGNLYINGVKYEKSVTKQAIARNFYIGGVNGGGTGNAKFYYVRLWSDANTLVRDMIPAINSSNVVGMYDVCGNTWYACTGAIAGPPLAVGKGGGKSLPEEYQQVEWLQNINKTEYISINRTVKSNTVMKVNLAVTAYKSGAYNQIMGYAASTSWTPYTLGINTSNVICTYGGTCSISGTPPSSFTTVTWTSSNSSETSGSTLGLFKATGSPGDASYPPAQQKISYAEILEGTTLLYRLFPCYRKSDMKPGMYDTVNGVFYTNAGSGEFILGPTVCPYYSWEPNAGSGTQQGLYTNLSGIYDSSKGWVADFSTSSVEMPGLQTLLGSSTNFSFAIWFKRSSGGGWNTIWGCIGFELEGSRNGGATNQVVAYTWGQSSFGGIEYTLNEWHHLVMTRNASESKFYLDGELKYTGSAASIPNTALFLGAWKQHGSQSYLGQMTNMMLFDTVLTAAQVKELYGQ